MTSIFQQGLLFADQYRMDRLVDKMGAGFRDRRGHWSAQEVLVVLAIVATIALVGWLVIYLARRLIKRFRNGPMWLFLRLCQAHGLAWPDRSMLWQLARFQKLREPAYLFVDPNCWEESRIDPRLFSRMAHVGELRDRLFRDLPARQQARRGTPLVADARPNETIASPPGGAAPRPALDLADWLGASQSPEGTLG